MSRYTGSDEIVEVRIRAAGGRTLDIRKANKEDDEEGGRILRWLIEKWGWRPKGKKDLLDTESDFLNF